MPLVSMIVSTHNDALYIQAAIDSILGQTFTDFELILIDDASTDATPQLLAQQTDPRLIVLRNEQNLGLTRSLNRGLEAAQGRYIARMDADDIAVPLDRLEKQVAFMESHPTVGMICGNMASIRPDGTFLDEGKPVYSRAAGSHAYLRWCLLWGNPISHITVLIRREVLTRHHLHYQPEFNTAEDYDLWSRLSHMTELVRMQEIWAHRRVLTTSVSNTRFAEQMALTEQIMEREMGLLLGYAPDSMAAKGLFAYLHQMPLQRDAIEVRGIVKLLAALYQAHQSQFELTSQDAEVIQGEMVGYLVGLAQLAPTTGDLWYALQALRSVKPREFYAWRTIKLLLDSLFSRQQR